MVILMSPPRDQSAFWTFNYPKHHILHYCVLQRGNEQMSDVPYQYIVMLI